MDFNFFCVDPNHCRLGSKLAQAGQGWWEGKGVGAKAPGSDWLGLWIRQRGGRWHMYAYNFVAFLWCFHGSTSRNNTGPIGDPLGN